MTQHDNNLIVEQEKRELWPGRYYVEAQDKFLAHEGKVYSKVGLKLFQPEMPEEEAKSLLEPLGFTPDIEDYLDIKSQAEETFSEQQVNLLQRHLIYFGISEFSIKPAYKPQNGRAGLGARDSVYKRNLINLLHPGPYPDPDFGFEVWAYFGEYMKAVLIDSINNLMKDIEAEGLEKVLNFTAYVRWDNDYFLNKISFT